jgi:uncharacterized protein (DUF302 family)
MKKAFFGVLIGFIITLTLIVLITPGQVVSEKRSPMGYEETIAFIQANVTNSGWKVSALMELDKTLAKEGKVVLPVTSMKICQPDYAEQVLKDDDARFLSVMMPCSIAVYQKADGKTYVATMNSSLIGKLFGGTVSDVMAGPVSSEVSAFIKFD